MKQLLSLVTVLLLCCFCNSVAAQQTYIRNYSTFTEYGTIPAATVPSSYNTNYNYNPQPAYEYKAPEKTEEDIAKEAWREDLYATKEQLNLYYSKKDYNSVITICNAYEERYPEGSLYPDIGVYMASAYLHTQQYEALANRLEAKYQYFGDRHDFNLAAADVLQQYCYYERAYWYYKLVAKSSHKFDGYELGYSVTAARQGEEAIAAHAFSLLMSASNNNPNNYYNRALAFLNVKNPSRELALQDLVMFVTKTTETLDAYLLMAKIYAVKGYPEECRTAINEYKKINACSGCDELVAQANTTFENVKNTPAYLAEKKKSADALLAEQKKVELQQAKEKKLNELAEAEQRNKVEKELIASSITDDVYYSYLAEHSIKESMNYTISVTGKFTNYVDAIKAGDLKSVYILWKQGNDINASCGYNCFTLLYALYKEQYAIAHFLIINNFDLTQKNNSKHTPLHFACQAPGYGNAEIELNGPLQIARLLIEKGADINAVNSYGYTPLHHAALKSNINLAKLLLENGAVTDIKGDDKKTPLALAKYREDKEMITLLKQYKAK